MDPDIIDWDRKLRRTEAYIALAQTFLDDRMYEEGEALLLQALEQAEVADGTDGPLVGIVLLELTALYEKQNRELDANRLWRRICKIVTTHADMLRLKN